MTRLQHACRCRRESLSKRLGAKARAIYKRDKDRCVYCGATEGPRHLDHVIPRVDGGTDTADNLIVACASCNSRRRHMNLRRYMRYLRESCGWSALETTTCLRRVRRHLAQLAGAPETLTAYTALPATTTERDLRKGELGT
jgi:hypothetical protein